ncbi:MAG: serine hydroxymethyltransferase, partial [Acidimicrobiia bacterium]|nr:serine hydroxymethyltransferase [Acidimicrobiia bacterium]
PNDPRSPFITSGLRLGTPSVTTAGMKEEEMVTLAGLIVETLVNRNDAQALESVRQRIADLASKFPAYPAGFAGHV